MLINRWHKLISPTYTQDIAPNFAGTLLGITNCIGSIPGFVAPRIAGQIVNSDPSDINKWRIVWIIAIIILVLETIFYITFAAGTPQTWNFSSKDREEKKNEGKRDLFLVSY